MKKPQPFFSIIIPTLNEEKYLPDLLHDLTKQTIDNNQFEVIHVDGNSDDKTVDSAKKFKDKIKLITLSTKKRNVAHQRNVGTEKATGKWLVFMDADNRLPDYFLDGIRYQVNRYSADIYTTWLNTSSQSKTENTIFRVINLGIAVMNGIGVTTALGAMLIVKPKVFAEAKFPLNHKLGEDGLFVDAALEKGFLFFTLREPRYTYNLRRVRKEGKLKMLVIEARLILNYLSGDKFTEENFGYVMKGGDYYQDADQLPLLKSLHSYVKKATKAQLKIARQILKQIDTINGN